LCDGVKRVGGVSIGVLPEAEATSANSLVSMVLATGLGEACNALLARAAFCLIAIGEIPTALAPAHPPGKLVVGLESATRHDGVVHASDARAAVELVALAVLGMSPGR
jgi:hypothetical protein